MEVIIPTLIYLSSNTIEPDANLAMEEILLRQVRPNEFIVFFYVNRPSIIIGRYQNPWLECRVDVLEEKRIGLYRRISGGGTVYHDPGNVNFSFIMDRKFYNQKRLFAFVIEALKQLGIHATLEQKSNLVVQKRKFSGNAFCLKKDRALHHGTLLLDANLDSMQGVLRPTHPGIVSRGIRSNPVPVVNLKEIKSNLNRQQIESSICNVLEQEFGPLQKGDVPTPEFSILKKYGTWEWMFGESPAFDIQLSNGIVVKVEKGKITSIEGKHSLGWKAQLLEKPLTIKLFREQFLHNGIK